MKKGSPFFSGIPAPIDFFVGREKEIKAIGQLITKTAEGKSTGFFITGEQGIGKTSFANFSTYVASLENSIVTNDRKLLPVQCYLGAVRYLHDVCKVMVKSITGVFQGKRPLPIVQRVMRKYLQSLKFDLFGLGLEIKFKNDVSTQDLPFEFSSILHQFWKLIKEDHPQYKGLMLVLDDIEQGCNLESFPSFFKSLIDDISSHYKDLSLLLVLVGEDHYIEKLIDHYPPISSVLQLLELGPLSEEESRELISKALNKMAISIEKEALSMMVKHSGGLPMLLHEIGETVYWCDNDGVVDKKDVIEGLIVAANSLGSKQFRHLLYRRIRNSNYRNILFHLAKMPPQTVISTALLIIIFPNQKKGTLSSFIRRMVSLGILKRIAPGSYQFSSQLLRLYLLLEHIKEC